MATLGDDKENIQQYDHAIIKLWFVGSSLSRNFKDVMTIERHGDVIKIWQYDKQVFIVNWRNVTMIEEVEESEVH